MVLPVGLVGFSWSSQRRFEFPLDPAQRVVEFAIAAEPPFSPDPDLHVRWEKLRLGATRSTRMLSAPSFEVSEPARVVRAQPPGAFAEVSTSCARAVAFMAEVAARGSARCFTRQVYYRPDKVVPADALLTVCVDEAHVTQNPDWCRMIRAPPLPVYAPPVRVADVARDLPAKPIVLAHGTLMTARRQGPRA